MFFHHTAIISNYDNQCMSRSEANDNYDRILFLLQNYVSLKHQGDKVVVFERADTLVFVFNFHPTKSFTDYKIGVQVPGTYPLFILTCLI